MASDSLSAIVKVGAMSFDGDVGGLTVGTGGGVVSRVHPAVVEDSLPARSDAVTIRLVHPVHRVGGGVEGSVGRAGTAEDHGIVGVEEDTGQRHAGL